MARGPLPKSTLSSQLPPTKLTKLVAPSTTIRPTTRAPTTLVSVALPKKETTSIASNGITVLGFTPGLAIPELITVALPVPTVFARMLPPILLPELFTSASPLPPPTPPVMAMMLPLIFVPALVTVALPTPVVMASMPPPRLLPLFVAVALPLTTVAAKMPPVLVFGLNVLVPELVAVALPA